MTPDEYESALQSIATPTGEFIYLDVGDGPPTLFLHGLFMSAFMWHDVIDGLRGARRCIAYNLPFHGGSRPSDPSQPLDLAANVDMLVGFCDALGLESFDLVANDTGGALAQGLAVRYPDSIRTLTLTNCEASDWMPSKDELAQLVSGLARDGNLAPALKALYDDLNGAREGPFAEPYQWPERIGDDELRALMDPHQATLEGCRQLERFIDSLDPPQLTALEPDLRRLHVPTTLVWGSADTIFPIELAHWLKDAIPGCERLVEVAGGKLFWPLERGDELVAQLMRR